MHISCLICFSPTQVTQYFECHLWECQSNTIHNVEYYVFIILCKQYIYNMNIVYYIHVYEELEEKCCATGCIICIGTHAIICTHLIIERRSIFLFYTCLYILYEQHTWRHIIMLEYYFIVFVCDLSNVSSLFIHIHFSIIHLYII